MGYIVLDNRVASLFKPLKAVELHPIHILRHNYPGKILVKVDMEDEEVDPRIEKLIEKYRDFWLEKGFYNGRILGVKRILRGDSGIVVVARPIDYFHFLATNANLMLRDDLEPEDKKLLKHLSRGYGMWRPNPSFANPIAVDILLLCEDGGKLVLQMRSANTVYRGGQYITSISEATSPQDVEDGLLNIWRAVARGFMEELGIEGDEIRDVVVTGFFYDMETMDYKFLGYAITSLDEETIKNRFYRGFARDRYEAQHLIFHLYPVDNPDIYRRWSSMARAAYIAIQLHHDTLQHGISYRGR